MQSKTLEIANAFALDSAPIACRSWGKGHINDTYCVTCESGTVYVLQRINPNVFPNPVQVMENVVAVTGYLRPQVHDARECLTLLPTRAGGYYLLDDANDCWRVYEFIDGAICLQAPETPLDFYESAVAFGRFAKMLADFPADTLYETIPDFHNTPARYRAFHAAVDADPLGRKAGVLEDIARYLARENEAGALHERALRGELPLRVTHNDTKLNNVMFDAATRKALCVVDLDTVMPGLSAHDFGDAIRFGASTAAEDERDLARVSLDLDRFYAYTEGFLDACGSSLTPLEIACLPLGAKLITLECGMRFLTDYLLGDTYFKIDYCDHNLVRSRTQMALVCDMERKWAQMERLVAQAAEHSGQSR